MVSKAANSFTTIICRFHTPIAVAAQQLATHKTHDHCCTVSIGALEFGTPGGEVIVHYAVCLTQIHTW